MHVRVNVGIPYQMEGLLLCSPHVTDLARYSTWQGADRNPEKSLAVLQNGHLKRAFKIAPGDAMSDCWA
jgi:hypothetical protein